MGLFGSIFGGSKATNPFDQMGDIINPPMRTLGFGDGITPNSVSGPVSMLPTDPRIAQALKPGFFANDGAWRGVLGAIGDGLSVAGGGQPMYSNALEQRRQEQRQMDLYNRQRADKFDDWRRQRQDEIDNPQPTQLQQNLGWVSSLPEGPQKEAAMRILQGAYSPEYMQAKADAAAALEAQRYGNRVALKGIPQASNARGGGGRTKTIGGMTYYNVGGKWYDNPEGR